MYYDALVNSIVAGETASVLEGHKLSRIWSIAPEALLFDFGKGCVLASLSPSCPAFFLTEARDFEKTTTPFADLLRKRLKGATLTGVQSFFRDRGIRMQFEQKERFGVEKYIMVFEFMGRASNAYFLDGDFIFISSLRPVSSGPRKLAAGIRFEEYMDEKRLPCSVGNLLEILRASCGMKTPKEEGDKELCRVLVEKIAGMSPILAEACVERFHNLAEEDFQAWFGMVERLFDGKYEYSQAGQSTATSRNEYGIYYHKEGRRGVVYPFRPSCLFEKERELVFLSEGLDILYRKRKDEEKIAARERALEAAKNRLLSREKEISLKIQETEKALKFKEWAELILGALPIIPEGRKLVITNRYGEKITPVEVPLAGDRSPTESAQYYFHQYKRARKRLKTLSRELEEVRAELARVEEGAVLSDQMRRKTGVKGGREGTADGFEAEAGEACARDGVTGEKESITSVIKSRYGERAKDIYIYRTDSGAVLFIGKTGTGNDFIVTTLARPEDYWFHARDFPASHVLLKTADGKEPSERELEIAARAAAYFSRAREMTKVFVQFTKRKYLRKTKGLGKGKVLVDKERVLLVEPGIEGLIKD